MLFNDAVTKNYFDNLLDLVYGLFENIMNPFLKNKGGDEGYRFVIVDEDPPSK